MFFVHEEAIAQLSKPLNALLRGSMQEAREACVKWEKVDKATFERFVQFAYTGDYTAPQAHLQSDKNDSVQACPPPEIEVPTKLSAIIAAKKRLRENEASWNPPEIQPVPTFSSLEFPLPDSRTALGKSCEPAAFNSEIGYLDVFLGHSALYILGDFKLIDSLKAIALHRLHKTLCLFSLNDKNAADVINLARYVYTEEGSGGTSGEQMSPLRMLVCEYMASNASVFIQNLGFMTKLAEGGEFAQDFVKIMVQRKKKR